MNIKNIFIFIILKNFIHFTYKLHFLVVKQSRKLFYYELNPYLIECICSIKFGKCMNNTKTFYISLLLQENKEK